MKRSVAPHPEGVKWQPHLDICKACQDWMEAQKTKPRTISAFVKARGKDQWISNPKANGGARNSRLLKPNG